MIYRLFLVTLLLTGAFVTVSAEDLTDYAAEEYNTWYAGLEYSYAENSTVAGLNWTEGQTFHQGRVEYILQSPFANLLWVKRQGVRRFSFKGVVDIVVWFVSGRPKTSDKIWRITPLQVAMNLPNSTLKYRLSSNLQLSVATDTQYLPIRLNGADRGILFTPSVGLNFYHHPGTHRQNLNLAVGYRLFWNADGANGAGGFALSLKMYGFPLE